MGSKAEKKVVVAGKYCVGKTALVTRFTKNRFCELSPYQPTIGAAFVAKRVIVGTKCVNLGIWVSQEIISWGKLNSTKLL